MLWMMMNLMLVLMTIWMRRWRTCRQSASCPHRKFQRQSRAWMRWRQLQGGKLGGLEKPPFGASAYTPCQSFDWARLENWINWVGSQLVTGRGVGGLLLWLGCRGTSSTIIDSSYKKNPSYDRCLFWMLRHYVTFMFRTRDSSSEMSSSKSFPMFFFIRFFNYKQERTPSLPKEWCRKMKKRKAGFASVQSV